MEWGPAKAAKSYYGWSVTSGPPSKVSTLVKAKFCLVKGGRRGRRYLVVHDAQNQLYDLHLRLFANTRMLHKLHYKCNLINQHICKLFQSSIQRNSTKQNPFCSLNIHDQQAISASRIFTFSHLPLSPTIPSQVASLIFSAYTNQNQA